MAALNYFILVLIDINNSFFNLQMSFSSQVWIGFQKELLTIKNNPIQFAQKSITVVIFMLMSIVFGKNFDSSRCDSKVI